MHFQVTSNWIHTNSLRNYQDENQKSGVILLRNKKCILPFIKKSTAERLHRPNFLK